MPAFHGSYASTSPPAVGMSFDRHGTTVVTDRGCLGASRSPDEWRDDRVLREQSGDPENDFHETRAVRREERREVVPGEPDMVEQERKRVRRDERGEGFQVSGAARGRQAEKMRADAGGTAHLDP